MFPLCISSIGVISLCAVPYEVKSPQKEHRWSVKYKAENEQNGYEYREKGIKLKVHIFSKRNDSNSSFAL